MQRDPDSVQTPPRVPWALVGLALAGLLGSLGTSIANVALPTLTGAFGASFQGVQWVVLAYLLAVTASIVGAGRLGDLHGRRPLLLGGLVLFTVGALLGGMAPTLGMLVAARAAQGVGAAAMMALTMASVGDVVPKERTGSAMGLLGTTSAIGTALGPSAGGLLIAEFGWRAVFLVQVPLALLALAILHRSLPTDGARAPAVATFDWRGTVALAWTLAAWSLAMTAGRGRFGALNVALLVAAALGAGAFALVERRAASPLIRFTTFDRVLGARLGTNVVVSSVLMTTLVVGPFYLSLALGLDAATVGLVMAVGPLVAALTGAPAGRVVDRFGVEGTTILGMVGVALGAFALAVVPGAFRIAGYLAPIVVLTASYALFQAANTTAVMKEVDVDRRGVVAALLTLSRNLGLVTGASVMGAVFTFASGATDVTAAAPEHLAAGMRITFAVAAALVAMALTLTVARRSSLRSALVSAVALLVLVGRSGQASASASEGSPRLVGRLELQQAYARPDGGPAEDSLLVNRARVGLRGTLFDDGRRNTSVADSGWDNVRLVYADVDHTVVRRWLAIRVGQMNRPFSRSLLPLFSHIARIDRPLTVGPTSSGDDLDIGVMVHHAGDGPVHHAVGLFGGGVPRFGVGAEDALASRRSATLDASFLTYDLSVSSAFRVSPPKREAWWGDRQAGAVGDDTQVSEVVAGRFAPVVCHAYLTPARTGNGRYDLTVGLNCFVHSHALKVQTGVSVRLSTDHRLDDGELSFKTELRLAF
jgi:MFS family permease